MFALSLSPGMQARLALARALAIAPGTLLLDEPTASLDPEASLAVESLIAYVAGEGTKVILVSHSLGQVRRWRMISCCSIRGKASNSHRPKHFHYAQGRYIQSLPPRRRALEPLMTQRFLVALIILIVAVLAFVFATSARGAKPATCI